MDFPVTARLPELTLLRTCRRGVCGGSLKELWLGRGNRGDSATLDEEGVASSPEPNKHIYMSIGNCVQINYTCPSELASARKELHLLPLTLYRNVNMHVLIHISVHDLKCEMLLK